MGHCCIYLTYVLLLVHCICCMGRSHVGTVPKVDRKDADSRGAA